MKDNQLDDVDLKIVDQLKNNGRLGFAELARRVGLSQTPCWGRVKNLEKSGVISGYQAIISQKALGRGETFMVQVTMDRHDDRSLLKFENSIKKIPEIVEASVIAGEFDFLLKVALKNTEEYEQFLRHNIYNIGGIRNVRTILVIRDIL